MTEKSETTTIHVNIDAPCPRCGRPGATGADGQGMCLDCLTRAMTTTSIAGDGKHWQRRPDIEVVVEYCIQRWHPHLKRANVIALGRPKATTKNGKEEWAKLKRASKQERVLYAEDSEGLDYILIVALDTWSRFTKAQRIALVDHELCHAAGYDAETDTWALRAHDLEEFRAVVERHGAWSADVELFVETARRVTPPQMTLDEATPGDGAA